MRGVPLSIEHSHIARCFALICLKIGNGEKDSAWLLLHSHNVGKMENLRKSVNCDMEMFTSFLGLRTGKNLVIISNWLVGWLVVVLQ